jgi:hypothetical protein
MAPESNVTSHPVTQFSPPTLDQSTQEKGLELHELLKQFKQATSTPLSRYVLRTPKHKIPTQVDSPNIDVLEEAIIRKSPKLQKKNNSGKAVIKLAQDLVAKKCGIIHNDESLDQMTLKKYLHLYQQPLTDKYMEVILKLTEVAVDKAKKKGEDV